MIRSYAETNTCRRHILTYFSNEPQFEHCGRCDNDLQRGEQRIEVGAHALTKGSFAIGDQVTHVRWGKGVVQEAACGSYSAV